MRGVNRQPEGGHAVAPNKKTTAKSAKKSPADLKTVKPATAETVKGGYKSKKQPEFPSPRKY